MITCRQALEFMAVNGLARGAAEIALSLSDVDVVVQKLEKTDNKILGKAIDTVSEVLSCDEETVLKFIEMAKNPSSEYLLAWAFKSVYDLRRAARYAESLRDEDAAPIIQAAIMVFIKTASQQ